MSRRPPARDGGALSPAGASSPRPSPRPSLSLSLSSANSSSSSLIERRGNRKLSVQLPLKVANEEDLTEEIFTHGDVDDLFASATLLLRHQQQQASTHSSSSQQSPLPPPPAGNVLPPLPPQSDSDSAPTTPVGVSAPASYPSSAGASPSTQRKKGSRSKSVIRRARAAFRLSNPLSCPPVTPPAPAGASPASVPAAAPVASQPANSNDSLGSLRRRFRNRTTSDAPAPAKDGRSTKHTTFRATKLDWLATAPPPALADSAALSASLTSLSSCGDEDEDEDEDGHSEMSSCDERAPASTTSSRAASPAAVAAAPLIIDPTEYISVFSTTAV